MTQTEIALKKALNPVWELYMRHDEEDCGDEMPDVILLLEQKLNEANDRLAAAIRMEEQFPDNRYTVFNRLASEEEIGTIKGIIKDVKNASTSLFAVAVTVFSNIPDVTPIFEKAMPLYEASVGNTNGSLIFNPLKNKISVQVVPASCAYNRKETLVAPEAFRGRPIFSEKGFAGLDYLYIDPKEDPSCKYLICKDCGEVYVMHISQIIHFRKKGLKMPKRCVACRERRRA